MDATDRWERIRALWAGDAAQHVDLLWQILRRDNPDPVQLVEAIEAAGQRDKGVEVEPETLARMREVARETGGSD